MMFFFSILFHQLFHCFVIFRSTAQSELDLLNFVLSIQVKINTISINVICLPFLLFFVDVLYRHYESIFDFLNINIFLNEKKNQKNSIKLELLYVFLIYFVITIAIKLFPYLKSKLFFYFYESNKKN